VKVCFYSGFCQNLRFEHGFLMVKLWWMAGKSWCIDGRFPAPENMPLFPTLFLAVFPTTSQGFGSSVTVGF
jgi:hypothetical protein